MFTTECWLVANVPYNAPLGNIHHIAAPAIIAMTCSSMCTTLSSPSVTFKIGLYLLISCVSKSCIMG